MNRLLLVGLLLVPLVTAPALARGQTDYGAGQPADSTTTATVDEFLTNYFDLFNARDAAAVDLVSQPLWPWFFYSTTYDGALNYLQNFAAATVKTHGSSNVRVHDTGHVSAELTYSGWNTPYAIYTSKFYLLPLAAGGYAIDGFDYMDTRVPEGMTSSRLDVALNLEGVILNDGQEDVEIPAFDVLVYHVENTEDQAVLTTGLYILPDGVSPEEAQGALANQNFEFVEYVGPTPVGPKSDWTYAFFMTPGTTYLVQAWTLDERFQNPSILEGDAYMKTFRVVD